LGFGYLRKPETKEPLVQGIPKPSKNCWVSWFRTTGQLGVHWSSFSPSSQIWTKFIDGFKNILLGTHLSIINYALEQASKEPITTYWNDSPPYWAQIKKCYNCVLFWNFENLIKIQENFARFLYMVQVG
jgi:hypothetical protein